MSKKEKFKIVIRSSESEKPLGSLFGGLAFPWTSSAELLRLVQQVFGDAEKNINEAAAALEFNADNIPSYYLELSENELTEKLQAIKAYERHLTADEQSRRAQRTLLWQPLKPGPKYKQCDLTAWRRIYILESHDEKTAFELMLAEERITVIDQSDRADRWKAFLQTMKRISRSARRS